MPKSKRIIYGDTYKKADHNLAMQEGNMKNKNIEATHPVKIVKDKGNYVLYYNTHGLAQTLEPDAIGTHDSGWVVKGETCCDYFEWVNDFSATNGRKWVKGNFENKVECSSLKALEEFLSEFEVTEWCYEDI